MHGKKAGHFDIDFPEAWQLYRDEHPFHAQDEVIVAVVDTGLDVTHEDLKNVLWTNSGEIPDNGIDDDRNGFVDDVHGANF